MGAQPPARFGADVTPRQAASLCVALCMGTLIEWLDFTVYSQLSNVITQVFFPPHNPVTAQLAFWGVYAAGFIARPVGAVLFGHIGDSYGRRATMLASIAAIAVPTILIGCLPTYRQAGVAAPVLMAVLRLIQGLAVGGEFGSAIVYLHELAPRGRRGLFASLGQLAIAPGIILGIVFCQAVLYACSEEQLKTWGWRLPFLMTAFAAPISLILRLHMPEPYEFLASRQRMVVERVASTAAARVARSFSARHAAQPGLDGRQLSLRLRSLTEVVEAPAAAGGGAGGGGGSAPSVTIGPPPGSPRGGACALQVRLSAGAGVPAPPAECGRAYLDEVAGVAAKVRHHVPLAVLCRDHWRGLALQFLLEASYGCFFYVFFSWVPPHVHSTTGVSQEMTLWALMLAMVLFAATVPATGHLCDKGIPQVYAYMAITLAMAVGAIPALIAIDTGSAAALMVLLPAALALAGAAGGLMTSIGPSIYPAGVRASGYNIGHNLAMSLWGGLTPLIVSGLGVALKPTIMAAGVLVLMCAVVSWCAGVGLVKVAPQANGHAGGCAGAGGELAKAPSAAAPAAQGAPAEADVEAPAPGRQP